MDFNFNYSAFIHRQLVAMEIGESKKIDSIGKTSYELGTIMQGIKRKTGKRFSLKTNKTTGEIKATRISPENPPINYTQFIKSQIIKMEVGEYKILKTQGKDTFGCSPFVGTIGRKNDMKFKLKTDKKTNKVWVWRVA